MSEKERVSESGDGLHCTMTHIHAPIATAKLAVATTCPDCGKRTRMLAFFTPWYGWQSTCIRCGRQWCDSEWMPLDFARGVRQQNIERAKRRWRSMPPIKANHFGLSA